MPPLPAAPAGRELVARRYQVLNMLGRGGFGEAYRAVDRLTGRVVTLKRAAASPAPQGSPGASPSTEVSLLREFQLLASLRHPHIVSVLDHGLDEAGRPFLCMDLQEDARTFVEAARGQPLALQLALLVQLLQAVGYLHRRGIIHRDLKPENVLVVGDQVRVIDFGLSLERGEAAAGEAGTLGYAAPEVIRGQPASAASDLYAVGVIAYQACYGRHPFQAPRPQQMLARALQGAPDAPSPDEPASTLWPAIKQLLSPEPKDRFPTAEAVIAALSAAAGQPLQVETPSTREGQLRSAPMLEREKELAALVDLLRAAEDGRGAVALVGGESGLGKSRLLEELAIRALAHRIPVARGQSTTENARLYEPLRAPLRALCLHASPSPEQAAALSSVVPDLGALLGVELPGLPELDPDSARDRLEKAVGALLDALSSPALVLLEDIHWAGSETLHLLATLARAAASRRVLVVASYRNDERPRLPEELPGAQVIQLAPLSREAIASLGAALIGEKASGDEVVNLLERETEGNPFFLVETVRSLAEAAGGLQKVGEQQLPARVDSGGTRRAVRRRLERLTSEDRSILRAAAAVGRQLDLELLAELYRGVRLEDCISRAEEARLVEPAYGRWRFSHDKLREGLLWDAPKEEMAPLHGRIAETLEKRPPEAEISPARLYHHYALAGRTDRESHYAALAGAEALQGGAYEEAVRFLSRALELRKESSPNLAALERQLGEAHFRCGRLPEGQQHLLAALARLGRPAPRGKAAQGMGILWQALQRVLPRALRPKVRLTQEQALEGVHAYTQLTRLAHHTSESGLLLYATLASLNLAEGAGLTAQKARLDAVVGVVAGIIPLHQVAREAFARAKAAAERMGQPWLVGFVLAHEGYYRAGVADWNVAEESLHQAIRLLSAVGDLRWYEEGLSILGYATRNRGLLPRALEVFTELARSARARGDKQTESWGLTNVGSTQVRLGELLEGERALNAAEPLLSDGITRAVHEGARVRLLLQRRQVDEAAKAAVALGKSLAAAPPRSFMAVQAYADAADALIARAAAAPASERKAALKSAGAACAALAGAGKVFPFSRPLVLRCQADLERVRGAEPRAKALLEQSNLAAKELGITSVGAPLG